MAIRRYFMLALAAALTGTLAGCTTAGFGWGASRQAGSTNAGASLMSTSEPKPSLLKSTSDKVAAAFTIKPKVIEANDPIKLTSKQDPVGPEVYLSAARLYENRGDFETASGQYRKALEISPKSLPALMGYARLKDRQGKVEEATKLYRKAIAAHPDNAMPLNDLGLCQARNSQHEAALESLTKAVQLDPNSKLYRNNVSAVLVDLGRSKEALDHLTHAHGEAIAHYNLGYLLYKREKMEPASRQFALAIEKDPSLSQAREMLNRVSTVASRDTVQKTQHLASPTPSREDFERAIPQPLPRASAAPLTSFETVPEQMPRHAFPPIRLPQTSAASDERCEPAPLPGDFGPSRAPATGLRSFPRADADDRASY